jgi:hypothetical protein
MVMHMGMINSEEIYIDYDIRPYCTVDTLAIAELFEKFIDKYDTIARAFKNTMSVIQRYGTASVIAIDVMNPRSIYLQSDPRYPFHLVETMDAMYIGSQLEWLEEYEGAHRSMIEPINIKGEYLGW